MQGKIFVSLIAFTVAGAAIAQDTTQTAQSTDNKTRSEVDNQSNSTRNNQQSSNDQNIPTKGGSMGKNSTSDQKGDFDSMDKSHHGYLTMSDVSNNKKLSANFKACDKDHDGRLSREEYNNCSAGM